MRSSEGFEPNPHLAQRPLVPASSSEQGTQAVPFLADVKPSEQTEQEIHDCKGNWEQIKNININYDIIYY